MTIFDNYITGSYNEMNASSEAKRSHLLSLWDCFNPLVFAMKIKTLT